MEVLLQYKEIIAVVLAFIFEIIAIIVFKKRPELIVDGLFSHLCDWIAEAEAKFKVGSDKMDYVLSQAKIFLGDKYIESEVKCIVEFILSLPEKKGKK